MDHGKFDRLTRLFGAPRSRRIAWRALLGAALLGTATRPAAAAPITPCETGEQDYCGDRRSCCPGKCFLRTCSAGTEDAFCCTEKDMIICGHDHRAQCCVDDGSPNPCEVCATPTLVGKVCSGAITGSYRRR
jgi:hypothetical protein